MGLTKFLKFYLINLYRKWGPVVGYYLFAILTFGQTLFCLGVWYDKYWLMYVGRLLYGAGNEGVCINLLFLVKIFVSEKNAIVILSLIRLVGRGSMSLGVWAFSYFYKQSESFTIPLVLTIVSCVVSAAFHIVYFEIQRRRDSYKHNNVTDYPFKFSELKNFSLRAYMIMALNFTIYGIFWSFQPMMTEALETGLG